MKLALQPWTRDLQVSRLPANSTLPYEHDGVLLLTARALSARRGSGG